MSKRRGTQHRRRQERYVEVIPRSWCPGDDGHPGHWNDERPTCPCCGEAMVNLGPRR